MSITSSWQGLTLLRKHSFLTFDGLGREVGEAGLVGVAEMREPGDDAIPTVGFLCA